MSNKKSKEKKQSGGDKKDEEVKEKAKRGGDKEVEKATNSYKGCLYTVGFKVSHPILLSAIDFFGPAKEDGAAYKVRVLLCRTEEVWRSRFFRRLGLGSCKYRIIEIMPECIVNVPRTQKGKNFTVQLPKPVYISPNVWTDIKFELVGPETECAKYGFAIGANEHDGVEFDFLAGSRQLPKLHWMPLPGSLKK